MHFTSLFLQMTVLFCRASTNECQVVQDILQTYEKASGQKLNDDKTILHFSTNTPVRSSH